MGDGFSAAAGCSLTTKACFDFPLAGRPDCSTLLSVFPFGRD